MNEFQKSRINVEINRLEEEVKRLEDQASKDGSMYVDACETYGSELGGPPPSIEIARNKAKELREKIIFLKSVLTTSGMAESLNNLELERLRLDAEIDKLNQMKVLLYRRMNFARYLEDLIK